MSFAIKDGAGATTALKTTLDGGEHVKHVRVDAAALPTGAATAANQTAETAEVVAVKVAAEALQETLAKSVEASTQRHNFGSNLMLINTETTTPVATNGAAAAITPAFTDGAKKLVLERVEFWEDDSGTVGTNAGRLATGDRLMLTLSEQDGQTLFRRFVVCTAADPSNRVVTIEPRTPIKLTTAGKKLMLALAVADSGGVARVRNLKGQCNVWFREET